MKFVKEMRGAAGGKLIEMQTGIFLAGRASRERKWGYDAS